MKVLVWSDEYIKSSYYSYELSKMGYTVTCILNESQLYEKLLSNLNSIFMLWSSFNQDEFNKMKRVCQMASGIPIYVVLSSYCSEDKRKIEKLGITLLCDPITLLHRSALQDIGGASDLDVTVDYCNRIICKGGVRIELSRREAQVLEYLYIKKNKIVYKEELIRDIWNDKAEDANVYMTIKKIRSKLEEDPCNPKFLLTRKGGGFMFREDGHGQVMKYVNL
ncbi:hypothetical protein A7K91_18745 [Paenibacillus oryzae]|uniref:OmpR/PhoB-type domain-containing protein n=1 Tax=Paenibacillus oryzae TaxID=1844972 RepID=A0A1A5YQS4_9BACL|nr:winged helix-turn-helix domain-containing protein [Paenibacillus oryzae]OBR67972.1 hypothetical protein A7K91_18745 [Paenibacillus oryzae]